MDLLIVKMKEEIIETLNSYPLPLEVKRLVINEVQALVTAAAVKAIEAQKMQDSADNKAGVEDDHTEN